MKLLGVDYGTKRVGIALSDDSGSMAFPHSVISTSSELSRTIRELANSEGVTRIIIGESKNFKGEENSIMQNVLSLKKEIEGAGFEVILEPEYMTSQQAERLQGANDQLDASSAAIILQSYIDRKTN